MGRKPKYATYTVYKPYIDVIMKDLGLTDKVLLEWHFGTWRTKGGAARLNTGTSNNKRRGHVWVEIHQGHSYTLKILMHELMHIKQYYDNRLSPSYIKQVVGKRGKVSYLSHVNWLGQEMPLLGIRKDAQLTDKYKNQPWEIEAYDYMNNEVARLFPNDQLPPSKVLVGVVGTVKFFKIAS